MTLILPPRTLVVTRRSGDIEVLPLNAGLMQLHSLMRLVTVHMTRTGPDEQPLGPMRPVMAPRIRPDEHPTFTVHTAMHTGQHNRDSSIAIRTTHGTLEDGRVHHRGTSNRLDRRRKRRRHPRKARVWCLVLGSRIIPKQSLQRL